MMDEIEIREKPTRPTSSPQKREPDFQQELLSGQDEKGNYILSLLVKKSYRIDKYGNCVSDIETSPLQEAVIYYDEYPDELVEHDYDLFPYKIQTDIVVKGYAQSNQNKTEFPVEVRVGKHKSSFLAIGKRKALLNNFGKIIFSNPEVIEKIPLRYDVAYGGWDKITESKSVSYNQELIASLSEEVDWQKGSPYRYPRNPVGKGFLVETSKEAVEQLELPNIEDFADRLSPDRLAVGSCERWPDMPIPRGTDWVNSAWFPRIAYFGVMPFEANPSRILQEEERGWALGDLHIPSTRPEEKFSFRCANGASLGLQVPFLSGDEECYLKNIHPHASDFTFRLPQQKPKIWVDGRKGKLIETNPVIHTLIIEPEENKVSIIWRGSGKAIRPYFPGETPNMPRKVKW